MQGLIAAAIKFLLQNNGATEGQEVSARVLMIEGLLVPYWGRKAKHWGDARISGV